MRAENCKLKFTKEPTLERKTSSVIEELLEVQCGQLRRSKTPGDPIIEGPPQFGEIYFQELHQILTVIIKEKTL